MADQQDVAQWGQANEKLVSITTGDPLVTDEETGDIAAWAKLNNLDRVFVLFHPDSKTDGTLADTDPIEEAALFGKVLTKHPGSVNWKFRELQSVPTYDLKAGQVSTMEKKNANWYMDVSGIPMISAGITSAGEWIDVIHGLDWLKALIENYVFTAMAQIDKVNFTDDGVQILVSQLRKALVEGETWDIITDIDITYPKVMDVAKLMKGQRTLPDVKFTAALKGAINKIIIDGTITL
jgi:hypothetical protein